MITPMFGTVSGKMRSQYKAPIDEADVPAIVAYLANHRWAP
jgi:hypothetical protein